MNKSYWKNSTPSNCEFIYHPFKTAKATHHFEI